MQGFSPFANGAFAVVFRRWMKTRFSAINVRAPRAEIPPDIPLMAVANHVSWWDGFLLIELQRAMRPGAHFHTVMSESELKRHPFLGSLGAIGIDAHSPGSILKCIRELKQRVEARPDSMIFFFPQGKIRPSWRRPLEFKRGVEIFCQALGDVVVMPVAIHIEPRNTIAPHAFVFAGDPVAKEKACSLSAIERAVQGELDQLMSELSQSGL